MGVRQWFKKKDRVPSALVAASQAEQKSEGITAPVTSGNLSAEIIATRTRIAVAPYVSPKRNIEEAFSWAPYEHTRKTRHTYIGRQKHFYNIEAKDRVRHNHLNHIGTVIRVRSGVAVVVWDDPEVRENGACVFAHELTVISA